jgi:uncharacterized phage protein gp47/JayE
MTYGLTPQGFNTPRLADVKQFLEDDFIASLGDVNTDPQSVAGQLIGIFAKVYADLWENMEDVYFSQYPNSAAGVSLDNVVQLNGITRLPATQTSVVATCDGVESTFIPANSLAKITTTGETFFALHGGSITRSNADIVQVQVDDVTTQPYTVLLNNTSYTYSLPVVTFSNVGPIFVASNVIVITINGVQLPNVNFTTDSNTTLAAVAAAIQAFDSGTACTAVATNPNIVTITPLTGRNVIVNSINITGGATQATFVTTFLAPANENAITAALTAIINAGTPSWTCVDNMDGTLTITANAPSVPFSCSVGLNLSVIYQASPITFVAQNYGPIPCPIGTLTSIVTPIAGWNSINNYVAGSTGTVVETDAQLRIRRQNSIKLLGSATVEAITAGLLQKVPGVTSATVFENTSLQQTDIVIAFPDQFTAGDTITVFYDTVNNFTVPFNTNQATTMTDLVAAFLALPMVASASFGGTGNQTVTVVTNISTVLTVDEASTDVSAMEAAINGGRPPKSFEAVVQGGTDEAVANQIWLTKPAGIETFGNVNGGNGIPIIDSQGNTQIIFFSRPSAITIWVQVALTLYTEETFPNNGVQDVALAIFNYGVRLGVGIDVLLQRVLAQIFNVPGIASGNMTIGTSPNTLGTSDIPIADNQISTWDLERISVTVV